MESIITNESLLQTWRESLLRNEWKSISQEDSESSEVSTSRMGHYIKVEEALIAHVISSLDARPESQSESPDVKSVPQSNSLDEANPDLENSRHLSADNSPKRFLDYFRNQLIDSFGCDQSHIQILHLNPIAELFRPSMAKLEHVLHLANVKSRCETFIQRYKSRIHSQILALVQADVIPMLSNADVNPLKEYFDSMYDTFTVMIKLIALCVYKSTNKELDRTLKYGKGSLVQHLDRKLEFVKDNPTWQEKLMRIENFYCCLELLLKARLTDTENNHIRMFADLHKEIDRSFNSPPVKLNHFAPEETWSRIDQQLVLCMNSIAESLFWTRMDFATLAKRPLVEHCASLFMENCEIENDQLTLQMSKVNGIHMSKTGVEYENIASLSIDVFLQFDRCLVSKMVHMASIFGTSDKHEWDEQLVKLNKKRSENIEQFVKLPTIQSELVDKMEKVLLEHGQVYNTATFLEYDAVNKKLYEALNYIRTKVQNRQNFGGKQAKFIGWIDTIVLHNYKVDVATRNSARNTAEQSEVRRQNQIIRRIYLLFRRLTRNEGKNASAQPTEYMDTLEYILRMVCNFLSQESTRVMIPSALNILWQQLPTTNEYSGLLGKQKTARNWILFDLSTGQVSTTCSQQTSSSHRKIGGGVQNTNPPVHANAPGDRVLPSRLNAESSTFIPAHHAPKKPARQTVLQPSSHASDYISKPVPATNRTNIGVQHPHNSQSKSRSETLPLLGSTTRHVQSGNPSADSALPQKAHHGLFQAYQYLPPSPWN